MGSATRTDAERWPSERTQWTGPVPVHRAAAPCFARRRRAKLYPGALPDPFAASQAPMDESDSERWMWDRARAQMDQHRRLKRKYADLGETRSGKPAFEPSVDIFETEGEFWILVALPGVSPEALTVNLEDGLLSVSGRRPMPEVFRKTTVHRLEIPYGTFERRLPLPPGDYRLGQVQMPHGCAVIQVSKAAKP